MSNLTKFENEVMAMLLRGEDDVLVALRKQFDYCKVQARELTGYGFFTTFKIPLLPEHIKTNKSFKLGDVHAHIHGLKNGAGFLLYVKNGVLDALEAYSYDEPWPTKIVDFNLTYTNGDQRDLATLRRNWQ